MADRNNFFSIFQKKKDEKKVPFDENYFHINVSGGKLHSEKITIEAVSVQGSHSPYRRRRKAQGLVQLVSDLLEPRHH